LALIFIDKFTDKILYLFWWGFRDLLCLFKEESGWIL